MFHEFVFCSSRSKKKTGLFSFDWMEDGHVAIKADNDKYITAKLNGSLYASQSQVSDKEMFYMTIINRPLLILRCDYGFIGFKTSSNPRIECNKSTSDGIFLETTEQGVYYLRGENSSILCSKCNRVQRNKGDYTRELESNVASPLHGRPKLIVA